MVPSKKRGTDLALVCTIEAKVEDILRGNSIEESESEPQSEIDNGRDGVSMAI